MTYYNLPREFLDRELQRLLALFQYEDFSVTLRDEPVLVGGGVDGIYYYEDDDEFLAALHTKSDVTARYDVYISLSPQLPEHVVLRLTCLV
jgi:hypothetical protein